MSNKIVTYNLPCDIFLHVNPCLYISKDCRTQVVSHRLKWVAQEVYMSHVDSNMYSAVFVIPFESKKYLTDCRPCAVVSWVNREHKFLKDISIGNELCLLLNHSKYDRKSLIILYSNNFYVMFLDENIDFMLDINFIHHISLFLTFSPHCYKYISRNWYSSLFT